MKHINEKIITNKYIENSIDIDPNNFKCNSLLCNRNNKIQEESNSPPTKKNIIYKYVKVTFR